MQSTVKIKKLTTIAMYILGAIIILLLWPFNLSNDLQMNYFVLMIGYIIVVGMFVIAIVRHNVYLFEPIVIVSILYICILIMYPIYDIKRNNMTVWGVDTSSGSIKGTMIFIFSYLSFYFAYYLKKPRITSRFMRGFIGKLDNLSTSSITRVAFIIWVLSFVLCIFSEMSSGYSLKYIFSFGTEGTYQSIEDSTALLFLSNFSTTMITAWMYIIIFSRSINIKIAVTTLTAIYVIINNGRWLMLIFGGAFIVYYYIKRKKSPQFFKSLSMLIIIVGIFAVMQAMRTSINEGTSPMDALMSNGFTIDTYLAPFESDFDTYKTYYGIVDNIPDKKRVFIRRRYIFKYTNNIYT